MILRKHPNDIGRDIADRYYLDFNIIQDIYPKLLKMKGLMYATRFVNTIPIELTIKIDEFIKRYEI